MARRKSQALADVPQTTEAAIALLDEYRKVERQCLVDRIVADTLVTETKRQLAERLAEREPAQKARFAALKAWWEAGGKDMAGKKRSAELAGAMIGVRLTPKAVKFAKGVKAEHVIARLKAACWSKIDQVLRVKTELDKQAIIKCVAESQGEEDLLQEAGVTVVQTDEFFIDTGLDEAVIAAELGA